MNMRTLILFAAGVLAIGQLSADTNVAQPVQATHTESFNFAPGGTIRIADAAGYVSVEAWDQPNIEVTVTKSMGYGSEPAAYLDSVKVATDRRSDTEFAITTTRTRIHNRFTRALGIGRDPAVEYHIRVPRNSNVVITHADGYVSVTGVTGNIEADNRRGDIVLMLADLAGYSIDAHTKIGLVTADMPGSMHRKHLSGEEFSHNDAALKHHLQLRMGFGGITIKELPAESLTPIAVAAK